jgi:hypothetical protein
MIWVRRISAIPLIIIFVILFIVVLLITQVNGTFANPGFYNDQLRQANMYNFVYDKALPAVLDEMKADLASDFTLNVQAIEDDAISAARKILPPEWLQEQVETATNAIIPYFLGSTDHFTYTVALKDRVLKASEVIKSDIIMGDAFASLYDDGISYAADLVAKNLNMLPYSLTFSKEELENSLKEALPQDWSTSQAGAAVDYLTSYMDGDSNHFTITIPLKARVDAAVSILTGLADQKIEAKFHSLPTCSMAEFIQAVQTLPPGSLPRCRPDGLSYQEFKNDLNIDTNVANSIRQMIGEKIPDQWSYTEADLVNKLGSDNEQTLNDARDRIQNGYTITETDLTDKIAKTDSDLNNFDTVRHRINTARTWLWTIWLIPFAFLVIIALLCGRNWISKLVWGLAVLFVTSLAIYIAVTVTYSHVAEPRLATGVLETSQYEGVEAIMVEKGNEVIHNVASAFASGIEWMTIYSMIGSGVVLLGLVIWRIVLPRTRLRRFKERTHQEGSETPS